MRPGLRRGVPRQEGEENFSIAMEFAQYHSTFHSFLECDPRGVEELFRGLGHRLGLNAQLSKQALLGELLQDFTEEWAALMAAEERRLQREAQQAGLRHAPALPRETVDLPHNILSLLYSLAGNPLSSPEQPTGALSLAKGGLDGGAAVQREPGWEVISRAGSDTSSVWEAASASSDLSSWGEEEDKEEGVGREEGDQAWPIGASSVSVRERKESEGDAGTACTELSAGLAGLAFEGRVLEWVESLKEARALARAPDSGSEAALVRHALLMMQGIPGEVFKYCEEERAFSAALESAQETGRWASLLEPLTRGASSWMRMRALTLGIQRSAAPPTQAAFGACLRRCLLELLEHPKSLEVEFANGGSASLLHLNHHASDWVAKVASLESCVDFVWPDSKIRGRMDNAHVASYILSRLFALCNDEYFFGGCRALRSKVFPILLGTLQPMLETLDTWVSQGEVDDPSNEFFVERDDSVPWDSKDFWSNGFSLRAAGQGEAGCPIPTFLASLEDTLLVAGKSAALAKSGDSAGGTPALVEGVASLVQSVRSSLTALQGVTSGGSKTGASPGYLRVTEEPATLPSIHVGPDLSGECDTALDRSVKSRIEAQFNSQEHWGMQVLLRADQQKAWIPQLFRPRSLVRKMTPGHEDLFALANSLEDCGTGSPVVVLQDSIKRHIAERAADIDGALLHVLKDSWGFTRQVDIIEATFMMGSSGFTQTFATRLFSYMRSKRQWGDIGEIGIILKEALSEGGLARDVPQGAFSLEVSPAPGQDADSEDSEPEPRAGAVGALRIGVQHSVSELERIRLRYRVPWPIHMIISESSLAQYNDLFIFLLQVKYAKNEMDKLQGLFTAGQFERKVTENIFNGMSQGMRWNRIEHLRHEILHFIHVIHHWLLTGFHSNARPRLEKRLEEVTGFDGVLRLHELFLRDSSLQSLIGSEKLWKSVAVRIKEILEMTLRFADACRLVLDLDQEKCSIQSTTAVVARSNSDLQSIDRQFHSSLTYLFTILSSSMRVSRNAQLAELITALNFNGFYNIHV